MLDAQQDQTWCSGSDAEVRVVTVGCLQETVTSGVSVSGNDRPAEPG